MDCEAMELTSMNNRSSKDFGGVEPSSTNKSNSKDRLKEWVLQVEESLKERKEQPHSPGPDYPYPYRRVPKFLKKKNTEVFYTPQVISFGPYHFQSQMKEPIFDDEVEVLKSEVAGKVHCLLGNGLFQVVEKFMRKETQELIEKIYAKGFPSLLSRDVLAWMMTRDACFLVAILNTYSKEEEKEKTKESQESKKQIPLLNIYHPLLNDFVNDMFKMENQLPLWVLDQIRNPLGMSEDDCFESAMKKLSPLEVSKKDGIRRQHNREHHILYLLHEYIVDSPLEQSCSSSSTPHPPASPRGQTCPPSPLSWGGDGTALIHRTSSSRPSSVGPNPSVAPLLFIGRVVGYMLILLILSPLLVICLTWLIIQYTWDCYQNKAEEKEYHVPTLDELKRIGVRFKKPITRYATLMNDLVNTKEDVAILRRHSIITSKLGSDDDVAKLWNSLVDATGMPKYEPIDGTAANINAYGGKKWKIFWAQFMMIHCSKPWLVMSVLGGISLLLLTIVQVACLFLSCQIQ